MESELLQAIMDLGVENPEAKVEAILSYLQRLSRPSERPSNRASLRLQSRIYWEIRGEESLSLLFPI